MLTAELKIKQIRLLDPADSLSKIKVNTGDCDVKYVVGSPVEVQSRL